MPSEDDNGFYDPKSPSGAGKGVDAFGGQVIDPTKNVLDLVKAESKYQDAMRSQSEKFQDALRDAENRRLQAENKRLEDLNSAENRRLEELSKSETRRIDDLDAQRKMYEARIAEDLRVNVKTTSDQLAGQLIKETGALSNQIATLTTSNVNQFTTLTASLTNQMTAQSSGINTRLADLERFRWETGGKSSEADPALKLALSQIVASISEMKDLQSRGVGQKEQQVTAHSNTTLYIIAAGVGIAALQVILHFVH